ncbi:Uncharacterized protein HZ326_30695, partial [Fusarium oxysporum f. sp. albedinis]
PRPRRRQGRWLYSATIVHGALLMSLEEVSLAVIVVVVQANHWISRSPRPASRPDQG